MNKIKLNIRGGLDGSSTVAAPPTFRLVEGWNEAELSGPVGILPAGLWGQVPAGDPYLLNICFLTTQPIDPTVFFELRTGSPMQSRVQYTPSAGNTRVSLVRPSDLLRLFAPPQAEVKVEMLVESIGGTNELGNRLHEWATAEARALIGGVRVLNLTANANLAAWTGLMHVSYDNPNPGIVTLPSRALVPLDAVLTLSRVGGGIPTLSAAVGDTFVGNVGGIATTRSLFVMNNGSQWTVAGT